MNLYVVYWLYDGRCTDPHFDGYVGITCRFKVRLYEHRKTGKFGDFQSKILFTGTREECLLKEKAFRPLPEVGWNSKAGGRGGRGQYGLSSRKKMAIAKVGNKNGLGWKPSQETIARMSMANRNKPIEIKRKGAQALVGYKHTEQARANMARSRLGRKLSAETRAKIGKANSAALKGKRASEETKQKMSSSAKAAWSDERRKEWSKFQKERWHDIRMQQ